MIPRTLAILMLTATSVAFAPPVLAQDATEVPAVAPEDVSAGQVVSFVNAMIAIERVRREYMPQIEAAETEEARNALVEEADAAAMAAVDKVTGISPAEYLAIGQAAQGSEELTQRITTRFAELRKKQKGRQPMQQPAPEGATQEDPAQEEKPAED